MPVVETTNHLPAGRAPRQLACVLAILVIGIAHRGITFLLHLPDLRALIDQNPDWLTWQYPTIPALRDHLGLSLLYLQQTPPIPTLILGLTLKLFGWPHGTAYALILLQGVLSIATAAALFALLSSRCSTYVSAAIAVVFLLSTDVIVMEYYSFGQLFYENLAMLLAVLAAFLFTKISHHPRQVGYALLFGLAVAGLPLCRASFSHFFVVPLGFLLSLGRGRGRQWAAFWLAILLLEIGWSAKNYVVYGYASLNTSSWAGANCVAGLVRHGEGPRLRESILSESSIYPPGFIRMVREKGLLLWVPPNHFRAYVPQEIRDQDDRIQKAVANTNRSENSVGQRVVSDLYMRAYLRFLVNHPSLILHKFMDSYQLFWEPIRNYSSFIIGPLYVDRQLRNSFSASDWKTYLAKGEREYAMQGVPFFRAGKQVRFYDVPYLPTVFLAVNMVVVHVGLPLLLAGEAFRWLKRRSALLPREFWFMVACYAYVALVANLGEHGENMRFRLSIEPVIWAISTYVAAWLAPVVVRALKRARTGAPVSAEVRGCIL